LQPGGHRFDPGQLHQKSLVWRGRHRPRVIVGQNHRLREASVEVIDRILGLGPLLIPIVAILVGGAIAIVAMVHSHQERIAKIERGINPDSSWPQK
jgi:hypothetical protein